MIAPEKCLSCDHEGFKKAGLCEHTGRQRWKCKGCGKRAVEGSKYFEWEDQDALPADYMYLKAKSVYRDGVWKKYDTDAQKRIDVLTENLKETFNGLPIAPPKLHTMQIADDILTVYPIGDLHLGMLAWSKETGHDFDLDIAEQRLNENLDALIQASPDGSNALVLILGDFFHTDNRSNRTEKSGHALDTDGRYGKMVATGVRILHRLIDRVRARHSKVTFRINTGNHDYHTATVVNECFMSYYNSDSYFEVVSNTNPFFYKQFGNVLICSHHGDISGKMSSFQDIMLADVPEMVGKTKARYWYIGHVHHQSRHEFSGCLVESFTNVGGNDYWAHHAGYRSGVVLNSIQLSHDGEIGRIVRRVSL